MRISDWSSDVCSSDLRLAKVVFEQTVEAIVVSDQRDRIVMVNPAFESLTGYAAVEVIGKNPKLLQSTRHEPGFYQRIEESVAREDWWQGEFWCRRSEEHTSELQSLMRTSYAFFCLKKKK